MNTYRHLTQSEREAYDFHWFHSGSGITTGFTSGRVSFATACWAIVFGPVLLSGVGEAGGHKGGA